MMSELWGTQPPPPPTGQPPTSAVYVAPRTNGFAVAAMVLGILWVYWIGSILALVFGYIAKSQIEKAGGRESGGGMAIAGIVLGWVGVGFLIVFMVFLSTPLVFL